MTIGKDSRIVWVEVDWVRERECERVGGGLSWPREGRRGKSGMVQWVRMLMYLIDKHLHLIIVLVRLCGTMLVPFSQIYAVSQFHSFKSPEHSSCMHAQRVQTRSSVNVERPSTSAAYAAATSVLWLVALLPLSWYLASLVR